MSKPKPPKPAAKPPARPTPATGLSIVVGGGIVQPATAAEFAKHVDSVVDVVNRQLKRAGLEHEALADELFRLTCNDDVHAAFDLRRNPPPLYVALRKRAGKSLKLRNAAELSTYVQVGALRQRVRESGFQNADWSDKVRLLSLVDDPDDLGTLHKALKHLAQKNAGPASLDQWIVDNTPAKNDGRPRGLTLPGAKQLAKKGHALGTKDGRAQLVKQLRKASPDVRRELLRDLRDMVKNVETVIAEVEDDGEDD